MSADFSVMNILEWFWDNNKLSGVSALCYFVEFVEGHYRECFWNWGGGLLWIIIWKYTYMYIFAHHEQDVGAITFSWSDVYVTYMYAQSYTS